MRQSRHSGESRNPALPKVCARLEEARLDPGFRRDDGEMPGNVCICRCARQPSFRRKPEPSSSEGIRDARNSTAGSRFSPGRRRNAGERLHLPMRQTAVIPAKAGTQLFRGCARCAKQHDWIQAFAGTTEKCRRTFAPAEVPDSRHSGESRNPALPKVYARLEAARRDPGFRRDDGEMPGNVCTCRCARQPSFRRKP